NRGTRRQPLGSDESPIGRPGILRDDFVIAPKHPGMESRDFRIGGEHNGLAGIAPDRQWFLADFNAFSGIGALEDHEVIAGIARRTNVFQTSSGSDHRMKLIEVVQCRHLFLPWMTEHTKRTARTQCESVGEYLHRRYSPAARLSLLEGP